MKNDRIVVRVTEKEKEEYIKLAVDMGESTLSDMVRKMLLIKKVENDSKMMKR